MKLTPQELTVIASSLLALLIGYFPMLADWYAKLDTRLKVSVMGGLLVLTAIGVFALSCTSFASQFVDVTCDQNGVVLVVKNLIAALMGSQSTFLLFVRPFKQLSAVPTGAQSARG